MPAGPRPWSSSAGIASRGGWWTFTRRRLVRILFVNEKCGYFGGIEQNVADTVRGLAARGHACSLAFQETTGRQVDEYQALFKSCVAMHPFSDAVAHVRPDVIYMHKADVRSLGALPDGVRRVRMIHDHDLCCPRRHKY